MKKLYKEDPWCIVETEFDPKKQKMSESIFSIGNGRMGQRANFEEDYSGDTLQGNYIAGVYYPDKTRVGWWKNGYPEYFAKVLNAANWIGIHVSADGEYLDLAKCKVTDFRRELNMKEGVLRRSFHAELDNGIQLAVKSTRFLSMVDDDCGLIRYSVTPLNKSCNLEFGCYIDGDIENEDSNYDEKFWDEVDKSTGNDTSLLTLKTKKLDFHVCTAQKIVLFQNGELIKFHAREIERPKYVETHIAGTANKGQETTVYKFATNVSSLNVLKEELLITALKKVSQAAVVGFDAMLAEQKKYWGDKWLTSDIQIEGDIAAQQAIRFNIFQLNQTYTGADARLNIGPKGFTGEKYGGSTYWDTEAYCLPFYMGTAGRKVARNLLLYRYKQLDKAIENAEKLGFSKGAALYPMVTMNGEECHNEWEITFEEIHRNGAIAFAIFNYIRHTDDAAYLKSGGLEVLLGISRFWAQRFNWSTDKEQFVMLGVTGPNEYENNVNNNWYTNYIARWTMRYTIECIENVQKDKTFWTEFLAKTDFNQSEELTFWQKIVDNVYEPRIEGSNLYLQQDGFLDKVDRLASDLDPAQRPINQHWSWDRILRSIFIKQADVLQGMYFFESHFSEEVIRDNFLFYEQRTLHESSLSPCVHSILASKLGLKEKAYEMYLRTARLDLDDYNHEADEGLHITSMAGTWLAVVEGFGGKRVKDGLLHFNPVLPEEWKSLTFRIIHRDITLKVSVTSDTVSVAAGDGGSVKIAIYGKEYTVEDNKILNVKI